MTTFLKKLGIFLAGLALLASALQLAADRGLAKSPLCREWEDLFSSRINADLLIQGSSRAWVQFSPKVLDRALGLNSYNLGVDGHNFLMQYYRFRLYEQYNQKPRYLIQNIDMLTLEKRKDLYALEQFLPYLDRPLVHEAVSHYQGFEPIDFLIPAAKYRHSKTAALFGLKECLFPTPSTKYKGFEAQDKEWDDAFLRYYASHPGGVRVRVDPATRELFDAFLSRCAARGIKVILVYAPEYIEAQRFIVNRAEVLGIFREFSRRYRIPLLDYSQSFISYDTRYFYNSQHLNARGVEQFNALLVRDLAPLVR